MSEAADKDSLKFALSSESNYSSFKKLPYLSFCRSLLVLTSLRFSIKTVWVSGMASYDVDGTWDVNTPDSMAVRREVHGWLEEAGRRAFAPAPRRKPTKEFVMG